MTDNEIEKALAELEEVEKRADGGPWRTRLDGGEWLMLDGPNGTIAEMVVRETGRIDNMTEVMQTGMNAALIAMARNNLGALIAEVRLLRGVVERDEQPALSCYRRCTDPRGVHRHDCLVRPDRLLGQP